jgi:RNA polymerase sigma factor (sigma-70 family)
MKNSRTALMDYSIIRKQRKSSNENQLVLAAQEGDRGAFNDLVLIYQEAVFNLVYRVLGETESAENITQNAFILAYRRLTHFRNEMFRSWLFRIATNACYDELRRRKRHPFLPIEPEDRTEEQLYLRRESEQTIQSALDLLDPDQRIVVVLVDLQEMDYQEAAQVLRVPVETVKRRLARGRERLRQIMIRQGVGHILG